MTRRYSTPLHFLAVLFAVGLLFPIAVTAADPVIDQAVTVRASTMRAAAENSSAVVEQLAANTQVDVYERNRLWVRVAKAGSSESVGWLRFTELRFGADANKVASDEPARSGGFAGFSRSVSGFLSGFRGRRADRTASTSTIGIRGLAVADLQAAHPDANALASVQRYMSSKEAAEQFAQAGGLRKINVNAEGQ